jgi:hypothetical protein
LIKLNSEVAGVLLGLLNNPQKATLKKDLLERVMTECIVPLVLPEYLLFDEPTLPFEYNKASGLAKIFDDYAPGCTTGKKQYKRDNAASATKILNRSSTSYKNKFTELSDMRASLLSQNVSSGNLINRLKFALSELSKLKGAEIDTVRAGLSGKYASVAKAATRFGSSRPRYQGTPSTSPTSKKLLDFFNYQAQDWTIIQASNHEHVQVLENNAGGHDFIMTDPHGHAAFIVDEIARLNAGDRLFICGDLTDRGPDNLKIIDALMAAKDKEIYCVRGNHEDLVLDVLNHRSACSGMMGDMGDELKQWEEIVDESPYPLTADSSRRLLNFVDAQHADSKALTPAEKRLQIKFWDSAALLLQNGGGWVFKLTPEESKRVHAYMSKLPYVIHVGGEFNIVHAAMPSYEDLLVALESGFVKKQREEITWGRPDGDPSSGDIIANPITSRTQIVTYSGHNSFKGDDDFYQLTNSINADFGTYSSEAMIVVDHTEHTVSIRCLTGAAKRRLDTNHEDIFTCLTQIIGSFVDIWNKTSPGAEIAKNSYLDIAVIETPAAEEEIDEAEVDSELKESDTSAAYSKQKPAPRIGMLGRATSDTALLGRLSDLNNFGEATDGDDLISQDMAKHVSEEVQSRCRMPSTFRRTLSESSINQTATTRGGVLQGMRWESIKANFFSSPSRNSSLAESVAVGSSVDGKAGAVLNRMVRPR